MEGLLLSGDLAVPIRPVVNPGPIYRRFGDHVPPRVMEGFWDARIGVGLDLEADA